MTRGLLLRYYKKRFNFKILFRKLTLYNNRTEKINDNTTN